ncbi:MAG: DUF202 domain-containing protein [Methylococcales bacterium]
MINETTLLAYLRTAMAFLTAATMFILFPNDPYFQLLGIVMLFLGILIPVIGVAFLCNYQKAEKTA